MFLLSLFPWFLNSLDPKTLRDHSQNLRHQRHLRALKISAISAISAGHYKNLPLREPILASLIP